MRNDLTACDRPRLATAAPNGRGGSRRRHMVRGLLALPLALALIAPGATALAAEATTNYGGNTPPPTTTTVPATTPTPTTKTEPTTSTSTPKGGVSPTSTSNTPTSGTPTSSTEPAKSSSEPTATTASAKTLPFTGLDLRWVILGGVLLVGMGMSILIVQRGRRGTSR
jgi:hypothetical protein